ncbi:Zn-dependent alcohol dehydrogenase [Streptomyces canus]
MTAAGVCHSDSAVMRRTAESFPYDLPLTLGHEGVGTVAALGSGISGLRGDDAVAVYGPWSCGICVKCAEGKENSCLHATLSASGRPDRARRASSPCTRSTRWPTTRGASYRWTIWTRSPRSRCPTRV